MDMTTPYLFVFAQAHDEFRAPELLSIAELYDFKLDIPGDFDISRPFAVLELEQEEHARLLARRCILIKYAIIFFSWVSCFNASRCLSMVDPCMNTTHEGPRTKSSMPAMKIIVGQNGRSI